MYKTLKHCGSPSARIYVFDAYIQLSLAVRSHPNKSQDRDQGEEIFLDASRGRFMVMVPCTLQRLCKT